MVFKLVESAQQRWRVLNAPHLAALVRELGTASNAANWSNAPPPSRHRVWCTMTDHHAYGTSTHTVGELVQLVTDCLGLAGLHRARQ